MQDNSNQKPKGGWHAAVDTEDLETESTVQLHQGKQPLTVGK